MTRNDKYFLLTLTIGILFVALGVVVLTHGGGHSWQAPVLLVIGGANLIMAWLGCLGGAND